MLRRPHRSLLYFFLFAAVAVCVFGDQTCSDKSQAITLKKSLFCGYDKTVRPVKKHSDTVNVSIFMFLKHFYFEEHKNVLYLNSWTVWKWVDALLQWDENAYDGMSSLRIESDNIWVPDVAIYTMGEMGGVYHRMPSTRCILRNSGKIVCAPPTSYAAYCAPDFTRWPFDTQECIVDMGSWTHAGKELNLTLEGRGIITYELTPNREWDLLIARAEQKTFTTPSDTFPYLEILIKLRRHAGGYAATVLVPAFVLAALTLLMLFLDAASTERLTLGCTNVLAHCLYLEYLGMMLPSNGESTPLIVAFFRDSLLLLGMSLLNTVVLQAMLVADRPPPGWISTPVEWVTDSFVGQLLLLNPSHPQVSATTLAEDGNGLADSSSTPQKNKKPWVSVAALLDRVCLIVFTITLVILLLAFVP